MSYSTIKFSDNLIRNKACTITYSGMLFQNNSEFVNIVYGFGNEWYHTKEQEMERTEDGFVVEVNMLDYDTFNFCFRNSNYEWDNNNYQNYTSTITEEIPEEINFILNDDSVISNIIDNLCEIDVSAVSDNIVPQTIETNIIHENAPFEIEIETNIPVNIEDSLVNVTEAKNLDKDIENLFTDIYQEVAESQDTSSETTFNMNNLIDEILSPVVKSTIFEEESPIIENTLDDVHTNFIEDLNDLEEDLGLDNKIDNLITSLFNNTKAFAENQKSENEHLNVPEIDKAIDSKIEELLSETPVIVDESTVVEEQNTQNIVPEIQEVAPVKINRKVPDFTIIEDDEENSIETTSNITENESSEKSLIELNSDSSFVVSPRSLGKFYMFKKKVKLAFAKLFVSIPKLLSKGFNTENN